MGSEIKSNADLIAHTLSDLTFKSSTHMKLFLRHPFGSSFCLRSIQFEEEEDEQEEEETGASFQIFISDAPVLVA
jgi:hypothetical protein